MPERPEPTAVETFWAWFRRLAAELERDGLDDVDPEELARALHEVHSELRWELGPGTTKEHFFAISPSGRRELLATCDKIIAGGPELPNWELLSAKPPKRWKRQMRVGARRVDARAWKYALTSHQRGSFFDICFYASDVSGWSEADRALTAWLVLEAELGERFAIEWFDRVELVHDQHLSADMPFGEIAVLASHIRSLTS